VLTLAAFFALATGLAEAGYWTFRYHALGELTHLPQGLLWMTPLAYSALFALPAAALALIAARARRIDVFGIAVTLLAALGAFSLISLYASLHVVAQLLLSLGIGAAVARLLENRRKGCLKLIRGAVIVLGCVVLIATLAASPRRSAPVASTPADRHAPNVLLIVLDTVRADALEAYGGEPDVMPFLNGLARRGVVFEQAYATAPWTLPSTAGMLTGRLPHEISADWKTPLDDAPSMLPEQLAKSGYATAAMVANTRYCAAETGLDRGFEHFGDFAGTWHDFAVCTSLGRRFFLSELAPRLGLADFPGRKSAADINREAFAWLPGDMRQTGEPRRPYFLFLNYFDAHHPYLAPPPFDRHPPRTADERVAFCHWWWLHKKDADPQQVQYYRDAYHDCLRYLDHELENLFGELERRGALGNTLVIVTSDHGEHFGDHELFLHGNSLYQALIHVPLIIVPPDRSIPGRRVARPVSLKSLPATVCGLAGIDHAGEFPGESLAGDWNEPRLGDSADATAVAEILTPPGGNFPCHGLSPVRSGPMRAIVSGRFKYIRRGDGREELYDLADDPGESVNLAGASERKIELGELRRQLQRLAPSSPRTGAVLP
jgi:arylsulfatase A-like enzyme